MRKVMIVCVSLVLLLAAGGFIYLKISAPLVAYQCCTGDNQHILLVDVGNKYPFGNIEIKDVYVNNHDEPAAVKMQVSNPLEGFIITDQFNSSEVKGTTFKDLKDVKLEPNTDPEKQLEKLNNGTATEEDEMYSITLSHREQIQSVIIEYSYLGFSYNEIVTVR